jgi:phosphoglycolate phosphatase
LLKALLFDLDGTLIDTPQAIVDITQATLAELRLPPADPQQIKDGIGLPLPAALGKLIGRGPAGAGEAVEIYRRLWRASVTPRVPHLVYPGVHEGLQRLVAHGLRLAVVTGKAQDGADSNVDAAGLRPFLQVVLGYTSVPNPKPAPDIALEAARRLGVLPAEAMVVGDATHDLQMARNAGMQSIAVTWGAQPEQALSAEQPTHVAHDFPGVVRIALAEARLAAP